MALRDAAARNSDCPPSLTITGSHWMAPVRRYVHPGSNAAAPVTPREPEFTKREKACLDSCPTRMQNFTPLSFPLLRSP